MSCIRFPPEHSTAFPTVVHFYVVKPTVSPQQHPPFQMRRSGDEIHSPPDRSSESDARELHARLQCLGSLMNENETPSGNASGHWNKASISMTVNHDGLTQGIHRGINYSSMLLGSPRLPLLAGPRSAQKSRWGLTSHTPEDLKKPSTKRRVQS